jgi:hypothetical protein
MEGVQDPKAQNRKHGVAGLGAAFFLFEHLLVQELDLDNV